MKFAKYKSLNGGRAFVGVHDASQLLKLPRIALGRSDVTRTMVVLRTKVVLRTTGVLRTPLMSEDSDRHRDARHHCKPIT